MPRAGWWAWPSPSRPTARGWPTRSTSWSWKRCWPPTSTPRPTPAPASAEGLLLEAVGDATALEVVGGDLDLDPITGADPDAVLRSEERRAGKGVIRMVNTRWLPYTQK